ncbi:MAG: hypothetical protein JSV88_30145 [Candidatus Aminicenantes bacterium]|nr:MAG: hypothetical protein JSV88_30145 [Candidatus Aminicenantes bacterium]
MINRSSLGTFDPHFEKKRNMAKENDDYSELEKLIPEIKQVAESDSPAQLEAGFFLVRYRQDKGETITWEPISPLVSRLFDLEKTSIIIYILDLSAIFTFLDEKELLKGAPVIADLLKEHCCIPCTATMNHLETKKSSISIILRSFTLKYPTF